MDVREVHRAFIIDRDAHVVLDQWTEAGLGERKDVVPVSFPFVSLDLMIQRIMREKPSILVVGFHVGNLMSNGVDLIEHMVQRVANYPYIIVNDANDANFDDVKVFIDAFASRNSDKLGEAVREFISFHS